MRRYCGSSINAFAAIMVPAFILLPPVFGVYVLVSSRDAAACFVFLLCAACSLIWAVYLRRIFNQLYTWAHFGKTDITVKTLFHKPFSLHYSEIRSAGIAYYHHGFLGSKPGSKIRFIYLSAEAFDDRYKDKINLWKPSQRRIKLRCSKKLCGFLPAVLPTRAAASLLKDIERHFN